MSPPASQARADLTVRIDTIVGRDGTVLVALPSDRVHGVAAEAKRSGATDLYVMPLAKALSEREAAGPLVIDVEKTTPFRLLVEVLFTASECGQPRWDVRLLGALHRHALLTPAGDAGAPWKMPRRARGGAPGLGLLAIIVGDGVGLKATGGNIAPGCTDTGPGLAIPHRDGTVDLAALRTCARKLKDAVPEFAKERTVAIMANPQTTFAELLDVIEALRGEKSELFPEVSLAITTSGP